MNRCVLALFGLFALPIAAAAQRGETVPVVPPREILPPARFAVTPYLGVRIPYNTGNYVVVSQDGARQFLVTEERGGGAVVGLNAEARVRGPLSAIVGFGYSGRQQDMFSVQLPGDSIAARFITDGPAMFIAKAGMSYRLPDPSPDNRRFHPSAFVTLAPALVWLDWEDFDGAPREITDNTRHFALNLGVDAASRIGESGWALQIGFEDFLTFWDTDAVRRRDEFLGASRFNEPVFIDYDYTASNILQLRLGLSRRF